MTSTGLVADVGTCPDLGGRVTVPIDGSPFAYRALPVAAALARRSGGLVDVVSVVPPGTDGHDRWTDLLAALHRLGEVAGDARLIWSEDPAGTLATLEPTGGAAERSVLLCMASHGLARLTVAALGAVTEEVLDQARRPVLVVGPRAAPGQPDAPVLAFLDGGPGDAAAARFAQRLAGTLDVPARLVSVVVDGVCRGESGDRAGHAALLAAARAEGVDASLCVVEDPANAAQALCALLAERPGQLVVVASATGGGLPAAEPALRLIMRCDLPVVVVPGPPGPA